MAHSKVYGICENKCKVETRSREYIDQLSNPNLLINGDFRVNQRGQSSYSGAGYGLDCWRIGSGGGNPTLEISNDNSVTLTSASSWGVLDQRLEDMSIVGKTVTLSCYLDNKFCSVSGVVSATNINKTFTNEIGKNVSLKFQQYTDHILVRVAINEANVTLNIRDVKLELGNVATPLSPRPIGEELALCQRYLWKAGNDFRARCCYINANQILFDIPLPTTMRATSGSIIGTLTITTISGEAVGDFTFDLLRISSSTATIRAIKSTHGLTDATLNILSSFMISAEL